MEEISAIKLFVSQNKIQEALDLLHKVVKKIEDEELINEVILKKSEYTKLRKIERLNTINESSLFKQLNNFSLSILSLTDIILKYKKKSIEEKPKKNLERQSIIDISSIMDQNVALFSSSQEKLDFLYDQNSLLFENIFGLFINKL